MTDYLPEIYKECERRFPGVKDASMLWAPSTKPGRWAKRNGGL